MGTIVDKFNYSFEAKDLIKDSINNLGGSITSETELKEYAQELDNIYDNIPKTTGEDTSLSLNTIKGKMNIIPKGDTQQTQYSGYNILNPNTASGTSGVLTTTYLGNTRYRVQGLATGNKVFFASMGIASGTYTLSITLVSGSYSGGNLVIQDTSNTTIGEVGIGALNTKVTKTVTGTIGRLILWNTQTFDAQFDIQIESGTTAHDYEPYVGGTASPNPSYPQEIEVVRGKNRFSIGDISSTNLGINYSFNASEIILNGTTNTGGYIYNNASNYLELPKGTYTFTSKILSGNYTYTGDIAIYFRKVSDNSNIVTMYKEHYEQQATITLTEITKIYVTIYTNASGNVTNNFKIGVQIEKGSQATSYLPYNTIEVKARGKNLADNSKLVNGYMTAEGIWHYGSGNEYRSTDLIEVKEGKTYSSNLYNKNKEGIAYLVWTTYDKDKNFIAQYTTANIVISSGVKYIRARNYQAQTSYITNDDYLYQVEENNTPTNYEPYYTPQIKQLSLGDIELCKIGNYQDYLYKSNDKWYKKEQIGKVVFTGASSENWGYWNGIIYIDYTNIKNLGGNNTNFFLNYLQHINSIAYIGDSTGYRLHINLANAGLSDITSASAWKTWLSTHNLVFYYVQNETDIEITNTTLVQQLDNLTKLYSYNGTTNITSTISSSGNLPIVLGVSALKGE